MVVSGRSIEQTYQKKTQLEHILLRPDTYVGSVEVAELRNIWLLNASRTAMERRTINIVPALYKIFDEILVNAADNKQRDPEHMDTIKVDIDREKGQISVFNNGQAIPVRIHSEHNIYVPELIFGHLLTSSNYDDAEKKTTGGRNGFGAKLTNIYSRRFVVETNDCDAGLYFTQIFENNMSVHAKPTVKAAVTKQDWTRITFQPDFGKFGMTAFDDDIYDLLVKRVYDLAGCTDRAVKVYLNGERLPVKTFKDYVGLYLPEHPDKQDRVFDASNDRWQIAVAVSDGTFEQVSFVNSIWTMKGGKHVDHVTDQICKMVLASISKKKGAPKTLKPSHIRNHLFVFVNSLIENPAFDSQTKETLTSNAKTFGSKCDIPEAFVKKVMDVGVRDAVLSWSKFRESKELKKNDGTKKSKIGGIPKLDDANWAGTKNSSKCTLILTEGDSAKALAVSGLSIVGRDAYGVFPLKGKLLNVRDASSAMILKNEEISNIKKILGLQQGHTYADVSKLRYGHLMIMTDQDHDGSHIKGLLINFLHTFWPSLLQQPSFLSQFITPIVKCRRGSQEVPFYTIPEYETWRKANPSGWKIKYFKGLGTSTSKDAKDYFSRIDQHRVKFKWDTAHNGAGNDDAIEKAFSKKRVEDRKRWLAELDPGTYIDYRKGSVTYTEFVDRELVLFSQSDNVRSIPSLLDGLKPGQRKILYSCFKRKLTGEIKVAQLSGYVAEHSAYHHGEASLTATIINLAQNYMGSNNINLLLPIGQFGTRHAQGKDAASPRYIYTGLSPVTRTLFPPEDDALLDYLDDDGMRIEPKFYVPIIAMVLVNGAEGIGTGWSTSVPQYNPRHLVRWVQCYIDSGGRTDSLLSLHPWYKGFLGDIRRVAEKRSASSQCNKYEVTGIVKRNANSIEILELPMHKSTDSYKAMFEAMDEKKEIAGFEARHTDNRVDFTIQLSDEPAGQALRAADTNELLRIFKLTHSISTTNMTLFNEAGQIGQYARVQDILLEHARARQQLYLLRKKHLLSVLERQCRRLDNKCRFIRGVCNDTIAIRNVPRAEIEDTLTRMKFDKLPGVKHDSTLIVKQVSPSIIDDGDGDDNDDKKSYSYLLTMPLLSLTMEAAAELEQSLAACRAEIGKLQKVTWQDMWRGDLDRFVAALDAHEAQEEKEQRQADATLMRKTGRSNPHVALMEASACRARDCSTLAVETDPVPDVVMTVADGDAADEAFDELDFVETKPKLLDPAPSTRKPATTSSSAKPKSSTAASAKPKSSTAASAKPKSSTAAAAAAAARKATAVDSESDELSDSDDDIVILKKKPLAERVAAAKDRPGAAKRSVAPKKSAPSPAHKKSKMLLLSEGGGSSFDDPFTIDEDDGADGQTGAAAPNVPRLSKQLSSAPRPPKHPAKPRGRPAAGASMPDAGPGDENAKYVKNDVVAPPARPAAKGRRAAAVSSDDDDDVKLAKSGVAAPPAPAKPATKTRRAAASARVVYVESSEEDAGGSDGDGFTDVSDDDDDDDY
ncbi:unnamed protein product (mitochondrion) [Plasmodiophora brassicae]|uniref:DNA topoisomerase 2 n=1 Tax=Plasmodiophora brassicae TaxID=37360 RepID=A0A3P3YI71_PLABS|nr:unnamed protein product [Plasmodiophora brassicae]